MENATIETTTATVDNDLMIMPGHLAAVAMFAAKKDIRHYLMGVCIDTGVGFATLDHEGKTVAYVMPIRGTIDDLPTKPTMTY